jgi:hypothetical protein
MPRAGGAGALSGPVGGKIAAAPRLWVRRDGGGGK